MGKRWDGVTRMETAMAMVMVFVSSLTAGMTFAEEDMVEQEEK